MNEKDGSKGDASERQFLHDLGSPLSTLMILMERITESLQSEASPSEGVQHALASLQKASQAVTRLAELLRTRREQISQDAQTKKS